jgi:4-hydroxybenzoate polyprenyltransferase
LVVLYALPVSYGYAALSDRFNLLLVVLFMAIGLQMLSLILMNEVEDIPEDRAHGVVTPCVRYGLRPISVVAIALLSAGGLITLATFAVLLQSWSARLLVTVIGSAGYALILYDIAALVATSPRTAEGWDDDPATFEAVRQLGRRNPLHFAILGLTFGLGGVLSLW